MWKSTCALHQHRVLQTLRVPAYAHVADELDILELWALHTRSHSTRKGHAAGEPALTALDDLAVGDGRHEALRMFGFEKEGLPNLRVAEDGCDTGRVDRRGESRGEREGHGRRLFRLVRVARDMTMRCRRGCCRDIQSLHVFYKRAKPRARGPLHMVLSANQIQHLRSARLTRLLCQVSPDASRHSASQINETARLHSVRAAAAVFRRTARTAWWREGRKEVRR
jgi:hypothetical protein